MCPAGTVKFSHQRVATRLRLGRVAKQRRRPTSGTVRRSDHDLIEALRQQFELLKSACSAYDDGNELEIINIATRLRVILQGAGSLISQLNLSKDLKFRDTSTHRLDPDRNICVANIGVKLTADAGAQWIPLFEGWPEGHPKPPSQTFGAWWTEPIMPASTPDGLDRTPRHSRQELVLAIANQDGGAHVGHRDADYDELTRDHFTYEVAWRTSGSESSFQPVQGNPVNVCVRQIGHEVLGTLALDLPAALEARARRVASSRQRGSC